MDFPRDLSGNIFLGRSAVARPPMRITVGTTLYRWSIYLLQRSTVRTVLQKCLMVFSKSSFVFRFCLARLRLSMFQTISIGFTSGDSDGQHSHQLMLFSVMNSFASLEWCFGSLSCWKRCLSGKMLWMKGKSVWFTIFSMKKSDLKIPSNINYGVVPRRLMPPQTWSFRGCFGLGSATSSFRR